MEWRYFRFWSYKAWLQHTKVIKNLNSNTLVMKNLFTFGVFLFLLFQITPSFANLNTGYYILQQDRQDVTPNRVPGKYTQLKLSSSLKDNGRIFRVEKLSDGSYSINQALPGRMVDAGSFNGGSGRTHGCQGCLVTLKARSTSPSQKWRLVSKGNGKYQILAKASNRKLTYNRTNRNFYMNSSTRTDERYTLFQFKPIDWTVKTILYTDLRAQQTTYKHQGSRGTCTYFASLAALEAAYKRAGHGNQNNSPWFDWLSYLYTEIWLVRPKTFC